MCRNILRLICILLDISFLKQGSHKLEKYLNIESFLEKSMKIKSALKSTGESGTLKVLKSP